MTKTYYVTVAYDFDGGRCEYTRDGFENVHDATEWAFKRIADIAHNWGEIQPDGGLTVNAEVYIPNDFSDNYTLICG